MIELPEAVTLAGQLHKELTGKKIIACTTGAVSRKWVFFKPSREAFEKTAPGKKIIAVGSEGRSVRIRLDDGRTFLLDEFGGKVLYHPPSAAAPKKHDLLCVFSDHSCLTVSIQMWGFLGLMTDADLAGWLPERAGALSMHDPSFTLSAFRKLFERDHGQDVIKAFFTNGKNVKGIGNGILQDILFRARLSPKRKTASLNLSEINGLYESLKKTVGEAIAQGGRSCERNMYDRPGGYTPLMDKSTAGKPCPECGTPIQKIAFMGGSCYLCPACQK